MPLDPHELPALSADRPEVSTETEVDVLNESHVYVHCYFNNTVKDMLIRIWKTTYLVDRGSGTRSKLVHAENISYAPEWTLVPDKKEFRFLLIFDALPRACSSFDLIEDIPQAGGFHIEGIVRNKSDVYHVNI
jgi:hypothetical protein